MSPIKRTLQEGPVEFCSPKRLRGGAPNDGDEQLFLEEVEMMEDEYDEEAIPPEIENDSDDNDITKVLKESLPAAQRWKRPDVRDDLTHYDELNVQWLDMDVVSGKPIQGINALQPDKTCGSQEGSVPILRTYGVMDEGPSVCVFIHGFTPYGCFAVPAQVAVDEDRLGEMRAVLQEKLASSRGKQDALVLGIEHLTEHRSIMGYDAPVTDFLKVYVNLPGHIPALKRVMEEGVVLKGLTQKSDGSDAGWQTLQPYENNVPFVLRFMVDQGLGGAGWLTLPSQCYRIRASSRKETHCQIEVDIFYDDLIVRESEGEWNKIAPLRILSLDIECQGRKGQFPEAEKDPVIQIANCLTVYGQDKPIVQNVFTLKGCLPIVGAQVITSEEEADLLMKWRAFLEAADPDIITGYNVQNFDIPYLLDRAATLDKAPTSRGKLSKFSHWGRIRGAPAKMRDTTFQSAAYGKRNNVETTIDGRVIFDMLPYMERNHKLSSYSLNSVCAEYLGQQKEDVHHSIISDLQQGSDEDRHRLAVYCLKDALLPQRLMDKLSVLVNYIEMARVTGVPVSFLISRGQQM